MTSVEELAEIQVHPDSGSAFESDFAAVLPVLREAPGCLDALLARSVDVPDTYVLRVVWARIEDHVDGFARSDGGEQVKQVLMRHCVAPPRVVHVESTRPLQ